MDQPYYNANVTCRTLKGTTMASGLMSGGYHANNVNTIRMKMEASQLAKDLSRLRSEDEVTKRRATELQDALQSIERELEAEKANEKVRVRMEKVDQSIRTSYANKKQLPERLEQNKIHISVIEEQLIQLSTMSTALTGAKTGSVRSLTKQQSKLQKGKLVN